jgi:hypothetical protein
MNHDFMDKATAAYVDSLLSTDEGSVYLLDTMLSYYLLQAEMAEIERKKEEAYQKARTRGLKLQQEVLNYYSKKSA